MESLLHAATMEEVSGGEATTSGSDIRVPERSEDGCPCRSEDDPALSPTHEPAKHKGTGTIRSDIRVPERSEGGFPVGARICTGSVLCIEVIS